MVRSEASGRRTRRAPGWALFLGTVLVLRLAGLGVDPPRGAGAAATGGPMVASQPGGDLRPWDDAAYGIGDLTDGTLRCLEARTACTNDDVLLVDTVRLRLAALAAELEAADPSDRSASAAELLTRTSAAASSLAAFLSTGCSGWVDGVAVTTAPAGCGDTATSAAADLVAFRRVLAELSP